MEYCVNKGGGPTREEEEETKKQDVRTRESQGESTPTAIEILDIILVDLQSSRPSSVQSKPPPSPRITPPTIASLPNASRVSNREYDLQDQLHESRQQIHFLQSQITSMNDQLKEQRDLISSLQVMLRRVDANTRPGRDSIPLSLSTIPVANAATSQYHA